MIGEQIQKWIAKYWFLRGVLGAFAILSPVASMLNIPDYEILRFARALLVGWDQAATIIGRWIGRIPFIPELSLFRINFLIFFLTVGAPAVIVFFNIAKRRIIIRRLYRKYSWLPYCFGKNSIRLALKFTPYIYAIIAFIMSYFVFYFYYNGHMIDMPGMPIISIVCLISFFSVPIIYLPGYAKGVFVLLSFIATFQALYFLPIIGVEIKAFTDMVLGPRTPAAPD